MKRCIQWENDKERKGREKRGEISLPRRLDSALWAFLRLKKKERKKKTGFSISRLSLVIFQAFFSNIREAIKIDSHVKKKKMPV